MKLKQFIPIVLITLGTTAFAQDWRQIGDGQVDLEPLHIWLANHKGERPLQHWKQVHIAEFKKPLANNDQCTIKLEDGGMVDVYITHLDASIKAGFAEITRIRSQAARIQAEIDAAESDLTNATRRQRKNTNSQLKQLRKNLSDLNKEENKEVKKTQTSKQGAFLAMNTGKTYGGVPVWDCGVKIAAPRPAP